MRYFLTMLVIVIMFGFVLHSAMELADNLNKRVAVFNSALKGN